MLDLYLADAKTSVATQTDPRLSPILAARETPDIFPPTLCFTAEFDSLRDDGLKFAQALLNGKVGVTCITFGQSFHGFVSIGAESEEALWYIALTLRECFNLSPPVQPD